MIKHLTLYSDLPGFFQRLKRGDVFTYGMGFDLEMVFSLAHEQGLMVQYCPPGTPAYREHGSMTCQVTWKRRRSKT